MLYMKKLTLVVALLAAVFYHTQGIARDYHVEIIVFKQGANSPDDSEVWDFSSESLSEELAKMTELAAQSVDLKQQAVNRLATIKNNLQKSGYKILAAVSWNQPSAVYQHAPVVSIGDESTTMPLGFLRVYKTALIFADLHLQLSPTNNFNTTVQQQSIASFEAEQIDQITEQIADYEADYEAEIPHYFIAEKRRLKFKEIHYFDHPKFAAILGVWPLGS